MRVALDGRYIQDHFPGIGRYTYQLAHALAPIMAPDTLVLLYDPSVANSRFALDRLLAQPHVEGVSAPYPVLGLRQQLLLPRLLARLAIDVYHSPYYVLPYLAPCPTVVTIHDLIPLRVPSAMPAPHLRHFFGLLIRLASWQSRLVLTGSEATGRDLESSLHLAPERMAAVPYGVGETFAPWPAQRVEALRQRLGLERPYVLYLGINKPHKNLPRLVEAWSLLGAKVRGTTQLVLAGREDARYPETRQAIAGLGLQGSVLLLGDVDDADVPGLYSGARAFVFPSLYEGFGLPVLEAMACGAPVVVSNRSSLPEVVGDTGLLFDPESVPSIADALHSALADEALRASLAQAGIARAARFTWERTARETLAAYRRALEGGTTQ